MNEEEFEDFKNYIKRYRRSTNDLVTKYITPYTLEEFRQCDDNFDYEPDLFSKYAVPNRIDELQQRYKQLQNNWNELKKWCKENQYNNAFDSYQVDNYTTYGVILKKIEEMEQGKDEN